MEFAGKVALITGGGGGIGRAAAIGFAGRGAKVVVVDLNAGDGEASAELVRQRGGEARFVRADVTKSADVAAYVKASARDGFQVVFSLAELDPSFTSNDIIVADSVEGKPLADAQGPMRIIAPKDKRGSRSVRMLERIEVVRLVK